MAGGFFGVRPFFLLTIFVIQRCAVSFFLLTFFVSRFHRDTICRIKYIHRDTICRIGYVDRLLALLTETAIVAVIGHFFGGVVKKVKESKNAEISVKTKEMDVFCHNMTYAFTTLFLF